ncbi:MAG: NUDIX domain-containing protein, partial [Casimicrobiaceae bacterium]
MAKKTSAGVLPFRFNAGELEVFLVHPGGPYWKNRDHGSWSIAKGEIDDGEAPLAAALREFQEETGSVIDGAFVELTPVQQAGGKRVQAWAMQADIDAAGIRSNTFVLEWPPRSGIRQQFPEVDRAEWFGVAEALSRILAAQRPLI